ncbi:hypothetical protein Kpol_1041p27 [Vanderwaltozyma polyspora DSM 70294]|uniref:Uncharacterized protein n=1 Tax=Vanderwaltozyma polyspora (strain ATCC 22028 / DSM 70294 / BCRC 21397 / CBS 2163 / NBRC 10782 / NRRL Y-8283 / UCD 57-17) TaxID=436907 RepID=A7TL94_VANPO|nr:uncharacterized protein Kpol_1041p27 [Vanderwaltozyma polyspora DSM 70294]EDO16969.1 hypothetical protein Kpol_1041p27 [Vanderwaltozyma polyspora DSM 70294]
MGLLSIIRKQQIRDQEIRVLVLGLDNAGKSTIVSQLMRGGGNPNQEVDICCAPTIGFEINSVKINGKLINIWDVGGQDTLRPYWDNYFIGGGGGGRQMLVWCVDVSAVGRVRLRESIDELKKLVDAITNDDSAGDENGCRVLVVGNKVDLCEDDPGVVERELEHTLCTEIGTSCGDGPAPTAPATATATQLEMKVVTVSGITGYGISRLEAEIAG